MRILIEIVVLLIAAAIGATASLTVLALVLLVAAGPLGAGPTLIDGAAVVWTAAVIAGTAFWPFVAAGGAARLIAGVLDQSRSWRWTGLYAAGLMLAVTGGLALMSPAFESPFSLMFVAASAIGAGTAGTAATLLINRATRPKAH